MLEIRHLVKYFGPLVAVDDVSFAVPKGEVLGFLGPNGAGKSTTMKMIRELSGPNCRHCDHLRSRHRNAAYRGENGASATFPRARRLIPT